MSLVHVKTTIKAPVERVWETVMDPGQLERWVTIHRTLRNAPQPPLEKGATMDQGMRMRGVNFSVHWTLVDLKPPSHAEWDGKGPANSRAKIRYELSSSGDGATEFEYFNEFTPPGGKLGSVASRVIVGATSEREANKSLSRLKGLVERS